MAISRDFERYAATAALLLLVAGCYLVLRPFLTSFLWGGIIAVSTRGLYYRVLSVTGDRHGLAAAFLGIALAAVLLVPLVVLGLQLTNRVPDLSEQVLEYFAGGFPPPPAWTPDLPLVGSTLTEYWQSVAADPQRIARDLRPLFKPVREFVLDVSAGLGAGILEFALALLTASLLHAWGHEVGNVADRLMDRLGGESARRQGLVVVSTVRGVFNGVLGTAAVQSVLAIIGFWIAGVPGALLLGMATFLLSVVPGGPAILWIPAAVWLAIDVSTGWAVFMAIWGFVVISGSDNIVRPLLIGQGVSAPLGLIFLGVIGGILAFGFLGLFIGPTLLAVGFNLSRDWLATRTTLPVEPVDAPEAPAPAE